MDGVDSFVNSIPEDKKEEVKATLQLALDSRADNIVFAFSSYFELVFKMPLLEHQKRALRQVISDQKDEKGTVIEQFRGAAKTTTFTVGLSSFLVGRFPDKSGVLIQVGDDNAGDNSLQVADIIENNPGFKMAFPHIVPDKDRGWGASGYEVKRTDVSYGQWRQMNAGRKDPSFVGLGYKSRANIGKRPFWLIVDDINDENNTSSERELMKVKKILMGTIFPAANMAEWTIFIGTPWAESDALHYCLTTGEFGHIKIPVYEVVNGEKVYTWPEVFDEKRVEREKNKAGDIEFARMFLLDLSKTKGLVLKKEWLFTWDHTEIYPEWPTYIGVDYTSTADPLKQSGDYFALAVGRAIPGGRGIVIEDGIRVRVSQAEAEDTIVSWGSQFPTLQLIGVEAIIAGQEFFTMLLSSARVKRAGLPLFPCRSNKSKGYRFEKIMAPLFQRRRVYISDAETPFLRAFKEEWINWQGDKLEGQHHNDTLDAVYWMIYTAQGEAVPVMETEMEVTNPLYSRPKEVHPYSGLGDYSG